MKGPRTVTVLTPTRVLVGLAALGIAGVSAGLALLPPHDDGAGGSVTGASVADVLKAKHDTAKNSVGNIR